jgi:hypothetical protein
MVVTGDRKWWWLGSAHFTCHVTVGAGCGKWPLASWGIIFRLLFALPFFGDMQRGGPPCLPCSLFATLARLIFGDRAFAASLLAFLRVLLPCLFWQTIRLVSTGAKNGLIRVPY